MIPTAIWPIMPAWMVFAETHFARERKKKKDTIIRISTTAIDQWGMSKGFFCVCWVTNFRVRGRGGSHRPS